MLQHVPYYAANVVTGIFDIFFFVIMNAASNGDTESIAQNETIQDIVGFIFILTGLLSIFGLTSILVYWQALWQNKVSQIADIFTYTIWDLMEFVAENMLPIFGKIGLTALLFLPAFTSFALSTFYGIFIWDVNDYNHETIIIIIFNVLAKILLISQFIIHY